MIRLINIGNDRSLFAPGSPSAARIVDYGSLFGEVHVVVFALPAHNLRGMNLADNVFLYPTNSSSKLGFIPDAIRIANRIIKNVYYGDTVISTQDPYDSGPAGVILKMIHQVPLQIQIHTDIFSREFRGGSLMNWLRFQISRFTLRRTDGIRVVRRRIMEELVARFGITRQKISVLPIFVDVEKIRQRAATLGLKTKYPQWSKIILVASRLAPEKNVKLAIQAVGSLVRHHREYGLVVVGSGPEELELKDQGRDLDSNIVFEPWQNEIFSYYKSADVFLNTSNFEGFGMALVEAAASGCPIVTTSVGIAQDLFEDGVSAMICPVRDYKCLASKIEDLIENPMLIKSLTSKALDVVNGTALSKDKYLSLYRNSIETLLNR